MDFEEKPSSRRQSQAQAYAAGMLDGEGWIDIARGRTGDYYILIEIKQTEPGWGALEYLAARFGGRLTNPRLRPGNRKPECSVCWKGRAAGEFLFQVRHHLRGAKVRPADLAIGFYLWLEKLPTVGGRKWTAEASRVAQSYQDRIRAFNARGAYCDLTSQVVPEEPGYGEV